MRKVGVPQTFKRNGRSAHCGNLPTELLGESIGVLQAALPRREDEIQGLCRVPARICDHVLEGRHAVQFVELLADDANAGVCSPAIGPGRFRQYPPGSSVK